ncbi:MAG: TIGR02266 family protein [Proteobacteria bacterium]|nr:TIGR02266 family protein [Pseudomonadota bacterium]
MSKQRRARNGREAVTPAEGATALPGDPIAASSSPAGAAGESAEPAVDPADRRACPRAPIEAEISLTSEHNLYAGIANDISEGGVFVATYQPLPVGTEVAIELSFEGVGGPRLRVNGEVRWHRGDKVASRAAPGMGLRFIDLQDDLRQWIAEFVRQREPEFFDETPETAASRRGLPTAELAAAASRGSGAAAHSRLLLGLAMAVLLGLVGTVAFTMFRGPAATPPRAARAAAQASPAAEPGPTPAASNAAAPDDDSPAAGDDAQRRPAKEAPTNEAAPAAQPAAPTAKAVDPGLIVAERLRSCFGRITASVELKAALFVQPTGRVVRGFVTTRRGTPLAADLLRCTRERVAKLQLPLTLPRADFVEWQLTLAPTGARATLTKPRRLAP